MSKKAQRSGMKGLDGQTDHDCRKEMIDKSARIEHRFTTK